MKIFYSILLFLTVFFFQIAVAGDVKPSSNSEAAMANYESRSLPATIPVKRIEEDENQTFSLSTKVLIVFCLIVLILGFFLYSRKYDHFSTFLLRNTNKLADREIPKLSKQIVLTGKHSLHLVTWGDEDLLLGCADQTITLIARKKHMNEFDSIEIEESKKTK